MMVVVKVVMIVVEMGAGWWVKWVDGWWGVGCWGWVVGVWGAGVGVTAAGVWYVVGVVGGGGVVDGGWWWVWGVGCWDLWWGSGLLRYSGGGSCWVVVGCWCLAGWMVVDAGGWWARAIFFRC